jgi:NADPH-dependent curcumin reductase CurA
VRTEIVDSLEHALHTLKKLYTGANTGKLMIRVQDV